MYKYFLHAIAHIGERQFREHTEQIQVTVKLLFSIFQFAVHQHTDFLIREKPSCRFLFLDFIFTERVTCQLFIN